MRLHFIAIGDSAMHNLALALEEKGHKISGSDNAIYEPSHPGLTSKELLPEEPGWFPDRITPDLDAVILGMQTQTDNPELLRARELNIRIYSYPEFLFEHSRTKTRVIIGGSRGSTTVTSMILHVMNYHHKEVDYMVGTRIPGLQNMVNLTEKNDFIVLQGNEHPSSPVQKRPEFHFYRPNIALISDIIWNPSTSYSTKLEYVEQFRIFIDSIVKGGILVYNQEDEEVVKLVEQTTNTIRKHPYGTPEYIIQNEQTFLQTPEGDMPVKINGQDNLQNMAGAKWICQHMGIDEDDFYEAISSFRGHEKN